MNKDSSIPVVLDPDAKPHSHSGFGPFCSFLHNPTNIHFQGEEQDEKVLVLFRRHFSTNFSWIAITVLLLLLVPFVTVLSQQFSISLPLPLNFVLILLLIYYLFIFGFVFLSFFSWFYNVGIITNQRIIEIEALNTLSHTVASAYFAEVVDVKYKQNGVSQTLLNFGDVIVQTEAIRENFEFSKVPNPSLIVDIILDLKAGRVTHV